MLRYRIGEFAGLSGVSAKTLRFYDEIGLLRPAAVDPRTHYRFYQAGQLQVLASILALKELGVPLAEIRRAVGNKSAITARELLQDLKKRVERTIDNGRQSLSWIESALEQVEARQTPVPVVVKRSAPMWIASIRAEVNQYAEMARIEQELLNALPMEACGFTRGTLWHRCAAEGRPEGEPFVELKKEVSRRNTYRIAHLPSVTAACAFSSLEDRAAEQAYAALHAWLHARGHRLAGAMREIYRDGILEIQFPLQ
jgi:DNA-binding transcriptional MerR regulator